MLSSGSNFLVTILAARALSPSDFGGFAVAFAVILISCSLARGVASDPLLSAHASDVPDQLRLAVRSASVTAFFVAIVVGGVAALVGTFVGGSLGQMLWAVAVLLPGLTLQDFVRFVLIVDRRPKQTFLNDLLWFIVQLPLLFVVISQDAGPVMLLLAWGAAGNLAAVVGLLQARTAIGHPALILPWLRRHRATWHFFVLDNLAYQATNMILVIAISVATTMAQVGGFRAAVTVYAPLAIVGRGLVGVMVPELARRRDDPMAVRKIALKIGFVMTPMALVWALMTTLIPDEAGRTVLGESWDYAEPLLLLLGASTMVALFAVGAVVGMRALGAGRDGLKARLTVATIVVVCGTVGAALDGAHGAVLALALSSPIQMISWWRQLTRAARTAAERGGELVPDSKDMLA